MRFLIADDHEVVRRGVREMLVDEFPEASFGEASGTAEALEKAIGETWDLVVLDVQMPGRGGLETLEEIKKSRPRLPVLVLSMHPESEYAVRAFRAGASGYIHKGGVSRELITAVNKALSGGRYITAEVAELFAADLGQDSDHLPHHDLSAREYAVMKLIATGHPVKAIATDLSLSEKTVFTYRSRMLEKLGLACDVDVARYALRHRLVD